MQENFGPPDPESKGGADSTSDPGERDAPHGAVVMLVKRGESVADFQARARRRIAEAGSVFDFASWLREDLPASKDNLTHPSWEPYTRLAQKLAATDEVEEDK